MAKESKYSLFYYGLEPIFMLSTTLERLAENKDVMISFTSAKDFQEKILQKSTEIIPAEEFTRLRKDILQYPEQPTPEKIPINKIYFENHGSLICEYLRNIGQKIDNFEITSITLRIFESGSIGMRCSLKPVNYDIKFNINEAVGVLRECRIISRKLLFETFGEFVKYWNRLFPLNKLIFGGSREFLLFEKYEYINFDLNISELPFNFQVIEKKYKNSNLNELVGFCRMSKPYTWPNFQNCFMNEFLKNDVSSRNDELWLVCSERFVRYYPNREFSETMSYAFDMLLLCETLLGIRASYKSLLEEVRTKLKVLPVEINKNQKRLKRKYKRLISNVQDRLITASYQLARTQFPVDVQFYTETSFSKKLIKHIENVLELDELSKCLETELDKSKNVLDSFSTLILHHHNISLQRLVLLLTFTIGVVGIILAVITLFYPH